MTLTVEQENAHICEHVLHWHPCYHTEGKGMWHREQVCTCNDETKPIYPNPRIATPTFLDWPEAGLIQEAWVPVEFIVGYDSLRKQWYCGPVLGPDMYADTGPLAIRAAILEHTKAGKS